MATDPALEKVRRAVKALELATLHVHVVMREAQDAGHTQRQIAEAAGVSQAKVWRILSGQD